MEFAHTMVRVYDLEKSLDFYINKLWLFETSRRDDEKWKYTNIFLWVKKWLKQIEITYNWWPENKYTIWKNIWHIAFEVDDIYKTCENLINKGVTINRPPRDWYMAFIKSPDDVSIELLQKWEKLMIKEPWASMENIGSW